MQRAPAEGGMELATMVPCLAGAYPLWQGSGLPQETLITFILALPWVVRSIMPFFWSTSLLPAEWHCFHRGCFSAGLNRGEVDQEALEAAIGTNLALVGGSRI